MFYGKAILLLWLLIASCDSANILGIATYDGNSHWLVMQSIFKSLAEAGHHVTVVTPYSKTAANVTLIDVSKYLPLRTNSFSFTDIKREYDHPFLTLHVLPGLSLGQCDKAHALPQVRQLLNGDHKFDVVISEIFGADCDAVFAHLLKVPLISVVTSTMLPWANYRVGNPENPAYVSNVLLPYAGVMSFNQRFINTLYYIYTATIDKYNNFLVTALNRKHFGNGIPPAEEIHRRTALVFVNSHVSIDEPRPFVPNVVEIGGIHLPPVKPLPKDLAEFMDNSRKGVIYFSLGSIIRAASLPNETINAFKQAFAELDLNVLWKFEDESLDVPSNVIVRKWFPQRDLLAHPNMKLAIVHGGLMGIYELVDVGIPAIGLPIFFDQQRNIANLASKGSVIGLEFHKLNKDYFLSHIRKILGDESYRIRAKQLSKIFHDRLVTPSQSVVYWTEYVIRHHGADHLRSTATDLSWYQYLLVDVFLSIIGALYLSLFISRKIMRTLTSACFVTQKKSLKNGIHYKTS